MNYNSSIVFKFMQMGNSVESQPKEAQRRDRVIEGERGRWVRGAGRGGVFGGNAP